MDKKTIDKLNQLHPKLRAIATAAWTEAMNSMPNNITLVIDEAYRSFAESDALYAQGRSKPGPVVTDAPGGKSYHNYGLALDFHMITNGKDDWSVGPNWMKVVSIMKSHGFTWGADWNNNGITRAQGDKNEHLIDAPHFENRLGHHWDDLLALHRAGKLIPGTDYVII